LGKHRVSMKRQFGVTLGLHRNARKIQLFRISNVLDALGKL
jgi:hypothetical protein